MNKKVIILLIIILTILIGFITLYPNNSIDQTIMKLAISLPEGVYTVFYYITFLGSRTILIPFTVVGSVFLYFKSKKLQPSLVFINGTLLSYLLNELIKLIVLRPRPSLLEAVHATGYSFPSGHAMISTVCYSLFTYYLLEIIKNKKVKKLFIIFTVILIMLIGFSRVILNVHYFTDVISGFMFGGLFIMIYLKVIKKITQKSL